MKIDVFTIFPNMFSSLNESIIGRAQKNNSLSINVHDIRPFSKSKHSNTDDYPFGGGNGMLMMAQPIAAAFNSVLGNNYSGKRIYLSPQGKKLNQELVIELSKEKELALLCGHYEGVDQRILDKYIDIEISIGDYVLTGGELPAMVLIDSISRNIEGVLGNSESAEDESFSYDGLLEYPQYTRPRVFEGMEVPEVLMNGNHKAINEWRHQKSLEATFNKRPDLLENAELSKKDIEYIERMSLLEKNVKRNFRKKRI